MDRAAARSSASCPRPTASISGGCCRRRCTTRPPAWRSGAHRRAGLVRRAERQPRQRHRLRLGAQAGRPIGEIVLAHNANRTVPDFLEQGVLRTRAEHRHAGLGHGCRQSQQPGATHGAVSRPRRAARGASAVSIDDNAIRARIRADHEHYGAIWCPHTATAAEA